VAIKRRVSLHGIALNYETDLKYFDLINPCGLKEKKMTSMAKILGKRIPRESLTKSLCLNFREVFKGEWEEKDAQELMPDWNQALNSKHQITNQFQ
jgi:lipoyl(octanoyl) transferase